MCRGPPPPRIIKSKTPGVLTGRPLPRPYQSAILQKLLAMTLETSRSTHPARLCRTTPAHVGPGRPEN